MPKLVTAREMDALLVRWGSNELSASEVHSWAEARFATHSWEPENDAVNEVLSHLDRLDMNLVVVEDIPLLREALLARNEEDANRLIERSYAITPLEARKLICAEKPIYAPFCN
ncbi:hypothetical protein [Hydrogenophaga sp. SL48]|uniref:hypothetical protein n=1 Tax=Hydrogenophaga sp. SL48 TaxID=2806347 RepID=UPI001F1781A8|nr:hypothetical protein [Hydrogenophaga sp. SL48]UJW81279.1 hypothetical protein IM738_00585 [Hydrogenophaga sp. SL48]